MSSLVWSLCYMASVVLAGLSMSLVLGAVYGWATIASGLAIQLGYHLIYFRRMDTWSQAPAADKRLSGIGAWDEIFARLYKHEKDGDAARDALNAEVARLSAVIHALKDGVIMLDAESAIRWCNTAGAQQFGLNLRTDIGQHIGNLVRDPALSAYLADAEFSQPLKMQIAGGDRLLSIGVLGFGEGGRILHVRDVTQEAKLDRVRRDFIANVSHELRTPLTVIKGFAETLLDLPLDVAQRNAYLGLIAEQSQRMQQIVQDLLSLSSLDASPPPPTTERVDVSTMLANLLRDANTMSKGKHRINLSAPDHAGYMLGAEHELHSAFTNLVTNALRYTPDGGEVSIVWDIGDSGATLAVTDTGMGIDPEHLPRLTERFYRVDRGRSRESGGTGLGLAIVKNALARHQATLEIESTPGKGSTFRARFPASRVQRDSVPTETPVLVGQ